MVNWKALLTKLKCYQVIVIAKCTCIYTYKNAKAYVTCVFVHVGEETPEIDICLDVEQGLHETADKLLMIIHEFCSIHLECEHVRESHSRTVSSVTQLLCDLHEIMDTRERKEVAQFVSHNAPILVMLTLAISRHRTCKLHAVIIPLRLINYLLRLTFFTG